MNSDRIDRLDCNLNNFPLLLLQHFAQMASETRQKRWVPLEANPDIMNQVSKCMSFDFHVDHHAHDQDFASVSSGIRITRRRGGTVRRLWLR